MNFTAEAILIVGSFLLFISIIASKISTKLGIPTLLIFLAVGMLAGSEGIGGISLHNAALAKVLGAVTLTLILFSGGLDTEYAHIRPIIWHGVLLSTIGVLVTAFGIGYFIYWVTNFNLIESLLVGAIVSSTDAAAVFSILRSKNMHLKHNLAPTLELESGSNDVMAFFLMMFFTGLLRSGGEVALWTAIPIFFKEMLIGGIVGFLVGKAMVLVVNKAQLANEALYPGLTLSMILFTYSATNFIHGSGFLAVYIASLILGSQDFLHKKSLIRFYEGITWLMQVVMFIVLGLLVFPKQLIPVAGIGVLISLVLMFIARPLGVFLSLAFFRQVGYQQKVFISWVGLRGAVPIVFATYPLIEHIDKSEIIFHIVFFIVLTSVLFQGTTLHPLAKWLKLDAKLSAKRARAISLSEDVKSELLELEVAQNSTAAGKKIVALGFPKNSLIVLINRNKQYLTPRGDTVIEAGDKLMIMTDDKRDIKDLKACLGTSSA
ncbi:MAG: potassium/proton antiporter [Bacteroidota bacterium]